MNKFHKQIERILKDKKNSYSSLVVTPTPGEILIEVGLKDLPILYAKNHLLKALKPKNDTKHYHGLTIDNLTHLPYELTNPCMVFDSLTEENSVCVLTNILDSESIPLMAAIRPIENGTYMLYNQKHINESANKLTSVYGKKNIINLLNRAAEENKILYINNEKSQVLFGLLGIQFPESLNNLSFDNIIHQSYNLVKSQERLWFERTDEELIQNGIEVVNDILSHYPDEKDTIFNDTFTHSDYTQYALEDNYLYNTPDEYDMEM